MPNAISEFNREAVVGFLNNKCICGCLDTYSLSQALGTISQRMIRNFTRSGDLKPIDNTARAYIYSVDSIADFLLKHPKYIFKQRVDNSEFTPERIQQLTNYIRISVQKGWQSLLKRMELEDVVSECLCRILRYRRTPGVPDSVIVHHNLNAIWEKCRRRIETVSIEDMNREVSDSDNWSYDNDDDEN